MKYNYLFKAALLIVIGIAIALGPEPRDVHSVILIALAVGIIVVPGRFI